MRATAASRVSAGPGEVGQAGRAGAVAGEAGVAAGPATDQEEERTP